ncbi:MAG: PilZ domain-containing protein [Thermoanaerobaculia bacterium]|nr:PilZ domain-containing protein [Thermoanaerobaculia bacterium]
MNSRPRRYPRIASRHTVLVTAVEGERLDRFVKTHTVGLGGCGISSSHPLGIGGVVELMISVRPRAFSAKGRVVYQTPLPNGEFDVGIEFLDIAPEDHEILSGLFEVSRETTEVRFITEKKPEDT